MKSVLNNNLITYLNSDSLEQTNADIPDIFIAFDEAHSLMGLKDNSKRSHFLELRWALHVLEQEPCFAFFLTTTGKILEFM